MKYIQFSKDDINDLFTILEETLAYGDSDKKAMDELLFLNNIFSKLPGEANYTFMKFLNEDISLPESYDEIIPVFERLKKLTSYCDKILEYRYLPMSVDSEVITRKQELNNELNELEKNFGKELLGFKYKKHDKDKSEDSATRKEGMFLLNGAAQVVPTPDIYKTVLFYEQKLGFKSVFLDDESQPHARLTRNNVILNFVQIKNPLNYHNMSELYDIKYDLYLYVSEPYLLSEEYKNRGIKFIKELSDAKNSKNCSVNREFIIEDVDNRKICFSQCLNIDELLGYSDTDSDS